VFWQYKLTIENFDQIPGYFPSYMIRKVNNNRYLIKIKAVQLYYFRSIKEKRAGKSILCGVLDLEYSRI
jgi:hypothetical protein